MSIHFHWMPTPAELTAFDDAGPDDFFNEYSDLDLIIIDLAQCPNLIINSSREPHEVGALFHASPVGVAFMNQEKAVYISAEEPAQRKVINLIEKRNKRLGIEMPADMIDRLREQGAQWRDERVRVQSERDRLARDLPEEFPIPPNPNGDWTVKIFSEYTGYSEDAVTNQAKIVIGEENENRQGYGPIVMDEIQAKDCYKRLMRVRKRKKSKQP